MKKFIYTLIFSMLSIAGYAQYQYMGTFDANGVPDYLDGRDQISDKLLADISASLPESYPVPEYNPHYISSGYDTDIKLQETADIWVTFVKEGAGYKNVLGYYTYDLSAPYTTSPAQEDITIIFPNVSEGGSGGGLFVGDRVKLGRFPANTGIGWVLIADGWKGAETGVTDGNWVLFSNPDFNPESNESDRFHNVLLHDAQENVIVLGFEDIRRDLASCDQDFNDALFYVTASTETAIVTSNLTQITDSKSEVSSGNNGGLESNGGLASAIAKRNFTRKKEQSEKNERKVQARFIKGLNNRMEGDTRLSDYLPAEGLYDNEVAYMSSPEDLVQLTNATDVFAIDYYADESRVSAALALETDGEVYNHTKAICDRLNGGVLSDIRYASLNGVKVIYAHIVNGDGNREYACWFSIRQNGGANEVYSLWELDRYPAGDYHNFQIWASSPGRVFRIAGYILAKAGAEARLHQPQGQHVLPAVFVQKGGYEGGRLTLSMNNSSGADRIHFRARLRRTELGAEEQVSYIIPLSGQAVETVEVDLGYLFDVGFEISTDGGQTSDHMYLADGAWGVDYNSGWSTVHSFDIRPVSSEPMGGEYMIERGFELRGRSTDVINVFRNLKAGHSVVNIEDYRSLRFDIRASHPVQVSLVSPDLKDWQSRFVKTVEASANRVTVVLDLASFQQADGGSDGLPKVLQSMVFSHVHSEGQSEEVEMEVSGIAFSSEPARAGGLEDGIWSDEPGIYPNPAADRVTIQLPGERTGEGTITILDMGGNVVKEFEYGRDMEDEVSLDLELPAAVYMIRVSEVMNVWLKRLVVR
ncbi:DUF4114 domain-containing protein [Roseivirga sp. BDSF3-8]|uniref:DUF4114 domain-containing protein n=1 Tax=Roseivirga sp. BDSF3-8 TaxID=3241598 RepID=UPI0035323EB3